VWERGEAYTGFWWGSLKGTTWGPRLRWEDNIKMDLQEGDLGVWTESRWLRIGTGGGRL